jgi:hypothetical protein
MCTDVEKDGNAMTSLGIIVDTLFWKLVLLRESSEHWSLDFVIGVFGGT